MTQPVRVFISHHYSPEDDVSPLDWLVIWRRQAAGDKEKVDG